MTQLPLQLRSFSNLQIFDNEPLVIYRYPPSAAPPNLIPFLLANSPFLSFSRTSNELSIIIPVDQQLAIDPLGVKPKSDGPWIAAKIDAEIDFSVSGLLAALVDPLAKAEIG
ncbi:hypothetical protein HK096_005689, partial [Nowakowskiella sp. JEL0078]